MPILHNDAQYVLYNADVDLKPGFYVELSTSTCCRFCARPNGKSNFAARLVHGMEGDAAEDQGAGQIELRSDTAVQVTSEP